ncbi:MAG: group II truncated hemoglobin [Hydrogenophaga sp.]|uniref:group II truncated hemoglobin n=1 Tax=Hydrogenophaga sp. TaxID=1904254 RepID=UPI0025C47D80|nr:group II truncated hemoglobin [Hydrogenophaga sp.]MBT9549388.1 group II truncated hemoglobin [Hydrogenophaga sp.]
MNLPHALPTAPLAPPSHFEAIGGQTAVDRLVDAFYAQMDSRPDATGIRAMHEPDLGHTKAVLRLYLAEWLGGPKGYTAQRGHPRLRMRHAAFPIGVLERDAWLACMGAAMQQTGVPPDLHRVLMVAFFKTADFMRNTPHPPATPANNPKEAS